MSGLFGTDGIRGLANAYPMNAETILKVGRSVAFVLQNNPQLHGRTSYPVALKPIESNAPTRRAKIVVGKDTRLSGYMLEQALSSGILSMGADVILVGPLSTPGVAYITQSIRADAGIMISASHNSFQDNGIKIFASDGFKFPDALEQEIERHVLAPEENQIRPTGDLIGKAVRIEDVHYRYLVYLKSLFAADLDLIGMKIAVDCANGAAYKTAPLVFEELGARVFKTGVTPNGVNINAHCGALFPENVAFHVVRHQADIGIALDGDGDRCILCDETGEVVDGDQIIGLCAIEMKELNQLKVPTIVTTPMSNAGLEVSLKKHGIKMERARVGDRHVVEKMRILGASLGGEQSGHLIFLDSITTGDGIVAALKVLEIMRRKGKKLSELKKEIQLFPQSRKDLKVKVKTPLETLRETSKTIKSAEEDLQKDGRVFVRYSGTENKLRILIESADGNRAQKWCDAIFQAAQKELET